MPGDIRNLQWLDHNSERRYPLAPDASAKDETNSFSLPDTFLSGLYLQVPWSLTTQPAKFFIYQIVSDSAGVQLSIGYDTDLGPELVAVARINAAAHARYKDYPLIGQGEFAAARGYVVVNSLAELAEQPGGEFTFDLAGGRLEVDCIRPGLRGIPSVQVRNGQELSTPLYGRLVFASGPNMQITATAEEGEDPEILFSAVDSSELEEDCVCDTNQAAPIRTLSQVGPDNAGNINILGDDCFEIVPGSASLRIKDKCSKPCCTCTDLEKVTSTLESLYEKATQLTNFLVPLEARVTQSDLVLLGSRLGDRGCVPAPLCPGENTGSASLLSVSASDSTTAAP